MKSRFMRSRGKTEAIHFRVTVFPGLARQLELNFLPLSNPDPAVEYRARLERWRQVFQREEVVFRKLGNWRLVVVIAAAICAWLAFSQGALSVAWLLPPVGVFIGLAIYHERVVKRQEFARRAVAYYERGLDRLDDRWVGAGNSGERFRDPSHVYADDLDVFGRGSLFELLCTARTGAGEDALAGWLRSPATPEQVQLRQQAVEELRRRLDLREDLALLGEDIRIGVHADRLAAWGTAPPVAFPKWSRATALLLSSAAVLTFAIYMAHRLPLSPFLAILLIELALTYLLRHQTEQAVGAAAVPGRELKLFSLLLDRLERETFQSPCLVAIRAELTTEGLPASRQIARLRRWINLLEQSHHMLLRLIAPVVLWVPQCAMGIEAWRRADGPYIGQWIAATGELEALCALAAYAYEHPEATWPELLDGSRKSFDADDLRHPLMSVRRCVPNNVHLGLDGQLLIVSGSNMSGKSTLLRAVGLSSVLAWAGAPVPARRLSLAPLAVGASLRTVDSLQDGRSRFYAEITRLRQIMDLTAGNRPVLFLLDELLSGTNSHDRRIGAEALVRGLVERGAIGMVTTHDLALATIVNSLPGRAVNVHFEDHLEDGQIRFDYKMRPGVVDHSNALELMRAVGLSV